MWDFHERALIMDNLDDKNIGELLEHHTLAYPELMDDLVLRTISVIHLYLEARKAFYDYTN